VAVRAATESMNGARFVHDELERCGWGIEVADAILLAWTRCLSELRLRTR
jgi:hypothetical protein